MWRTGGNWWLFKSPHSDSRLYNSFCCLIYCCFFFTCFILSLHRRATVRSIVQSRITFLGVALVTSSLWEARPGMKQKYSVVWCARRIFDIDTPLASWSCLTKPPATSILHIFTDHSSEVETSESGELISDAAIVLQEKKVVMKSRLKSCWRASKKMEGFPKPCKNIMWWFSSHLRHPGLCQDCSLSMLRPVVPFESKPPKCTTK